METDFNGHAEVLISEGRLDEARALLEAAAQQMPAGWKAVREDGERLEITFWDLTEFRAYAERHPDRSAALVEGSFSRVWYLLAIVAVNQKRFEDALFALDCGLELDNHPEIWNERGYVLGVQKRHEEALECYIRAAATWDWAPKRYIARALRGQGAQLIDLDRLNEAEDALRRSLELAPNSYGARHELQYIADLRRQRRDFPWFHSVANPPKDPLTVRLLALVDGMASIPGPQTVGAENYDRILDAFEQRGWEGFEEAFDSIVPPDCPDYEEVKRDLLRAPMFNIKTSRRIVELLSGTKTLDEAWREIRSDRELRKPQ